MEDELDVPRDYFDYVYSIYGIGWTTDLQGTFDKIASYLKKDGIFIVRKCIAKMFYGIRGYYTRRF